MGGRIKAARTIVTACLVAGLLVACARPAPEIRLRERIDAMSQALEARHNGDFMDAIAVAFEGPGGMDRAALHNLLRAQTLLNPGIGVTISPLDIELRGDRATVRFTAMLRGGRSRVLPERIQAYAVTTGWQDEQGQWRLYYAEWKPRL